MQGIYKITIKQTGKIYFGSSSRIIKRFAKHLAGYDTAIRINHIDEVRVEAIEVNDKHLRFVLERQLINDNSNNLKLLNRCRVKIASCAPKNLQWIDITDVLMERFGHIRYTR